MKRELIGLGQPYARHAGAARVVLGGTPFRWIAVGPTSVVATSGAFRAAADAGLAFPQRRLRIP